MLQTMLLQLALGRVVFVVTQSEMYGDFSSEHFLLTIVL